jgi:hypothetical protein
MTARAGARAQERGAEKGKGVGKRGEGKVEGWKKRTGSRFVEWKTEGGGRIIRGKGGRDAEAEKGHRSNWRWEEIGKMKVRDARRTVTLTNGPNFEGYARDHPQRCRREIIMWLNFDGR